MKLAAAALVLMIATSCTSMPLHPDVVLLRGPYSLGSGVVIAEDWVLTAKHVTPTNTARGLSVTRTIRHPTLDLALLYVPGLPYNGLPIGAAPKLHDRLYAYGWHMAARYMKTEGYQGGQPNQMSASVIHGCSGGAVVNDRGELVGIISMVAFVATENGDDEYALPHMARYTPTDRAVRGWISYIIFGTPYDN